MSFPSSSLTAFSVTCYVYFHIPPVGSGPLYLVRVHLHGLPQTPQRQLPSVPSASGVLRNAGFVATALQHTEM
jgi:hypothetical protein